MINFGIRNLKVFFKDKSSVFFSLLSVFIIIGLYALFIGDVWVSSFSDIEGVRFLMNSWIVAGLLTVTSVTTTMGAFGIMVEDKSSKINKDFIASPIKNSSIVAGYIISAIIIGIIMSIIALILSEIYIVLNGGKLMGFIVLIKVLGLIVLATIVNSSIVLFFVSFFNSSNAFATASTILGTMIGFLTGIYLPIGNLPASVQLIIKCFPISHAASLFRQVMMEVPLSISFNGVPVEYLVTFKEFMGVEFYFNQTAVTPFISFVILVVTAIVFFILSVLKLSRKQR
jgi:multidrug/hemolysin transport system permease protein